MLLTEMTSRKSSENKSRSYRQCVETIHGKPKLIGVNYDKRRHSINKRSNDLRQVPITINMVKIESRLQTSIRGG